MNALAHNDRNWRTDANCRTADLELFFMEAEGGNYNAARTICRSCPVMNECLHYALANSITHGMYGGQSPRERRVTAKRLGYTILEEVDA